MAPGGGYTNLAMDHEGRQVASFLNSMGVSAFVLKYRLGPRYHHPIELGDAQRAIRIVRSRAQELNVLPDRVGIMGFSAGGHLASTAATHFDNGKADAADPIDRAGCRPDFLILGYPVISTDPAIAHAGSVRNLLGENPDPKLLEDMSNDLRVTAQTPPTFIFQTNADTDCGRGEQRAFLPRVAEGEGPRGDAHLRERAARRRAVARGPCAAACGRHCSRTGCGDGAAHQALICRAGPSGPALAGSKDPIHIQRCSSGRDGNVDADACAQQKEPEGKRFALRPTDRPQ
mgnify:CR=1 FL=1